MNSNPFIGAKEKAAAFRSSASALWDSPSATERPSSSTGTYLGGDRGAVENLVGSNFRMPASTDNSSAYSSTTGKQLTGALSSGLSTMPQNFSALTQVGNQTTDAATNLFRQQQMDKQSIERAKIGAGGSSAGMIAGIIGQGIGAIGSLGGFSSFGGGSSSSSSSSGLGFGGASDPLGAGGAFWG